MGEQEEPRPLPFKETQAMPYLQAVIKEAIRLHSPAGISMARIVPKAGVNPWVTHIDPNVYGPDAQVFRPERWIDSDPEQLKRMERS
ncbi:hypothetical protein ACHAPD_012268 [Fusarium lateritium]